jgi:atypical dual specificity phosphatase
VRAALPPPTSARGVEDAAKVGRSILPNYCGPSGFHWIVPGRLAGCAQPGVSSAVDYDMKLLRNMGITHLITLTEKDLDQGALARNKLSNVHLPIYDREAPSMAQTYMLVRRMQVLLDQRAALSVHRHAGIGRTGTILAAWLIREGGLSATHAVERLRAICRTYVQTEVQEQFLQNFELDIMRRM